MPAPAHAYRYVERIGTPGDDVMYGAPGAPDDTTYLGPGPGRPIGRADLWGNASGGPGNDRISGGRGYDEIWGGADNDLIYGGPGPDSTYANGGADVLSGGRGDDERTLS